MGESYRRTERHEDLTTKVDFNGQLKFAQAEVICLGLLHIGNGLFAVAEALSPAKQPRWAKRMERKMSDSNEALARLSENIDHLTTEVSEIQGVLANLPTSEDPAIAEGINSAADRLGALKDALESATTLDDPAAPAEPETPGDPPTDPVTPTEPETPVDPANGEQPGDQPPADQPPTV